MLIDTNCTLAHIPKLHVNSHGAAISKRYGVVGNLVPGNSESLFKAG